MIYIRGDGNARIGAGHLMRCMAIAEELARLQGGRDKICFVCADEDSGALAGENGFRRHVLGTDYRDMESELPLWRELWEKQGQEETFGRDSVIVDSYYVTDFYLAELRKSAYTVLMDDMGTHCYPVDCVINYNAPASLEAYQELYRESGAKLLVGSRYTPLRRQFRQTDEIPGEGGGVPAGSRYAPFRRQFRQADKILGEGEGTLADSSYMSLCRPGEKNREAVQEEGFGSTETGSGGTGGPERHTVCEVLITTGGGDIGNIAGKILKRIYRDDFSFHMVTGRFHPDFQRMQELEKSHNNIHIHHDVKDMAGLMRGCRIALTAGGSTVYELAALGVPFICFSCAENQEALVDYIGSNQIACSAGAWHREPDQTLERIGELFGELAEDAKRRETCRSREMAMVDGKGAERLAEELLLLAG